MDRRCRPRRIASRGSRLGSWFRLNGNQGRHAFRCVGPAARHLLRRARRFPASPPGFNHARARRRLSRYSAFRGMRAAWRHAAPRPRNARSPASTRKAWTTGSSGQAGLPAPKQMAPREALFRAGRPQRGAGQRFIWASARLTQLGEELFTALSIHGSPDPKRKRQLQARRALGIAAHRLAISIQSSLNTPILGASRSHRAPDCTRGSLPAHPLEYRQRSEKETGGSCPIEKHWGKPLPFR